MSNEEASEPKLMLYNTLSRKKNAFVPIDDNVVRMYVCGPTVYDFAHIGNARPAIIFDVLFRLLRLTYGADQVVYVRNITDIDDKINARAVRDFPKLPLNEAIRSVTEKTTTQYQGDMSALGCLEPSHQPRATDNIDEMKAMIQLLLDKDHAYLAKGEKGIEVLFSVSSMPDYGQLANRKLEDQVAGARVAVESHKRQPGDFVLWKESSGQEPGWDADFIEEGTTTNLRGRPGWHLECSAMSDRFLWEEIKDQLSEEGQAQAHKFDIHGGGLDLIFPHHENELAQSRCCFETSAMANYWMHNGFLQVEGEKMSKSLGNFVTVHELLHTDKLGGKKWPGDVLRLAMLMTHYKEPIDFSIPRLEQAGNILRKWRGINRELPHGVPETAEPDAEVLRLISDDLNTPGAIQRLSQLAKKAKTPEQRLSFIASTNLMGIQFEAPQKEANSSSIEEKIKQRLALIADKNWTEADKIRDELLAKGVQLKDGNDAETGERVTSWEMVN